MQKPHLIVVMGPTASGKSAFAEEIADQLDCRLINADAFQVYRGMNIGTAKPTDRSRYELLDLKEPNEEFGVGEYAVLAAELLAKIFETGKHAVLVGGTGFYIRALIEEYQNLSPSPTPEMRESLGQKELYELLDLLFELDVEAYDRVDKQNRIRVSRAIEKAYLKDQKITFQLPPFEVRKVGIVPSLEETTSNVLARTEQMMQNGWVQEVQDLLNRGVVESDPGFRAIGYRAIAAHLSDLSYVDIVVQEIEQETIQYAKRQRTWLRSEPRLETYQNLSEARTWFRNLNLV